MIVRGAFIAIGVIAAAAVLWFTIGPGAGPPVSACSAAVTADPPPPAGIANEPPDVQWEAVTLPAGLDDAGEQIMLDVVAFGEGFVAVGRESNGPDSGAFFLISPDGVGWERLPGDAVQFAGAEVTTLAAIGDRLYGIGSVRVNDRGGSRGAVWFSDDGRRWREATGPFAETRLSSIAQVRGGLLLLGSAGGGSSAGWHSPDGETWTLRELSLPVSSQIGRLGPVLALGDGLVAGGSISRGVDAPTAPVIWRSGDGISWSCHLLDAAGLGAVQVLDLARSGASWLATGIGGEVCGFGAACVGVGLAWTSDGGLTWGPAVLDGPASLGGVRITAGDAGFLVVRSGATWWSADGVTWVERPDDGGAGAIVGQPDAVAIADDGRVAAVGTLYQGADADPWVAVGRVSP